MARLGGKELATSTAWGNARKMINRVHVLPHGLKDSGSPILVSLLKHLLSMAPSPEEQAKRNIDHDLRGLAYYDDFTDLWSWDETKVDPLHIANTPLLERPDIPNNIKKDKSSKVVLLNDYHNGYGKTGYEACQGANVLNKDYVCEYWQYVEAFNYFGHYRAMIPPAVWTNAGHRNGALILGTFCIEGGDLAPILKKNDKDPKKYMLADVLVRMASTYNFDGWLINIEAAFPQNVWQGGEPLKELLTQLKYGLAELPSGGKLIW
jgi:mannosyl-glycoprotein endo-beta-N-acetylglucosaminidase